MPPSADMRRMCCRRSIDLYEDVKFFYLRPAKSIQLVTDHRDLVERIQRQLLRQAAKGIETSSKAPHEVAGCLKCTLERGAVY